MQAFQVGIWEGTFGGGTYKSGCCEAVCAFTVGPTRRSTITARWGKGSPGE